MRNLSKHRTRGKWILSAVGSGLLLSAVLWQPVFARALIICASVPLALATSMQLTDWKQR